MALTIAMSLATTEAASKDAWMSSWREYAVLTIAVLGDRVTLSNVAAPGVLALDGFSPTQFRVLATICRGKLTLEVSPNSVVAPAWATTSRLRRMSISSRISVATAAPPRELVAAMLPVTAARVFHGTNRRPASAPASRASVLDTSRSRPACFQSPVAWARIARLIR